MPEASATRLAPTSRVLITGGSGFIGTNLIEFYMSSGCVTRSLDKLEPRNPEHRELWRQVDLTDRAEMIDAVGEFAPTHLLHFGARTDLAGESVSDYDANTTGTENVIAAANASESVERVVLTSSMLVCKFGYLPADEFDLCPSTPYGESKAIGEQLVRDRPPRAPWTIVRPTSIWGPWFGPPYRDFFAAVASGRYIHPGRRGALQTYGYVGNTVFEVDRLASSADAHGKTFYLGDWPPLNLHEWANEIAVASGRHKPRSVPLSVLRLAASIGDVVDRVRPGIAPLTNFRLSNMTTDNRLDLSELRELVGAELPWSLAAAVRETARWSTEHPVPKRRPAVA